jgi:hypothetical protein
MEKERKPPAPGTADDPLEPSAEDETPDDRGEHAPRPGKPGEDLTKISEEDD